MARASEASFGIYLVHPAVLELLAHPLRRLFPPAEATAAWVLAILVSAAFVALVRLTPASFALTGAAGPVRLLTHRLHRPQLRRCWRCDERDRQAGEARARLLALLAVLSAVVAVPSAGHERAGDADGSAPALALGTLARSPAATVGLSSQYLRVGDVRRHYLLYVPPALRNRPAPLVVAFHGLHLSAAWMTTHTGLVRAAAQAGVALALPDAISGAWNDGRLGPHGPDDVRFTAALVTELCRDQVAEPTRVTVAGYSNGAQLALELASRDPTAFDAVVSVSGALPAIPGAAHPRSPIAAYFIHGTADPVALAGSAGSQPPAPGVGVAGRDGRGFRRRGRGRPCPAAGARRGGRATDVAAREAWRAGRALPARRRRARLARGPEQLRPHRLRWSPRRRDADHAGSRAG